MTKRRMLQWMRDKLISHASDHVSPVAEAKVLAAAYKKAEPLVRKIVEAKFKPADMVVCEKYGLTQHDSCIRVQYPSGVVQEFRFASEETAPLIAAKGNCYGRMYIADDKAAAAVEAWVTANEAFKKEKTVRVNAYKALVMASGTLDDVIEVWPEVADLIPPANQMIPINPEQIAILKTDLRERKAA